MSNWLDFLNFSNLLKLLCFGIELTSVWVYYTETISYRHNSLFYKAITIYLYVNLFNLYYIYSKIGEMIMKIRGKLLKIIVFCT